MPTKPLPYPPKKNHEKNEIEKEVHKSFLELRKIMNAWDLMPGSSKEVFDTLNHQIIRHLYSGGDFVKINRVLESELIVTYGLTIPPETVEQMAKEIMEWWNWKNPM